MLLAGLGIHAYCSRGYRTTFDCGPRFSARHGMISLRSTLSDPIELTPRSLPLGQCNH